jgi:hypothetical protein
MNAAMAGQREPRLAVARIFSLSDRGIGDTRVARLVSSPDVASMRVLRLDMNRVGPRGARAIAASTHLTRLELLMLHGNRTGDRGARAFAASGALRRLRSLDLSCNDIGDEGAIALVGNPGLARLRNLYLDENRIGDAGAAAIAACTLLRRLETLALDANRISPAGFDAIAASRHLGPNVRLAWDLAAARALGAPPLAAPSRLPGEVSSERPLTKTPFRLGLCADGRVVAERDFAAGATVTVGRSASADLVLPGQATLDLHELVSGGAVLHLTPGGRVRMCGAGGHGMVVVTHEELRAAGLDADVPLTGNRLNVRLDGFSIFGKPLPSPPDHGAR